MPGVAAPPTSGFSGYDDDYNSPFGGGAGAVQDRY